MIRAVQVVVLESSLMKISRLFEFCNLSVSIQTSVCILLVALVSGCADVRQLYGGTQTFTLSPYPRSSGCSDSECRRLDEVEARGYQMARNGQIKWVQLVDTFYRETDKLFPDADISLSTREYRYYQRVLAEQMDGRRITEAQWVYLLEKKQGELGARNQALQNSRGARNCITEKIGLPPFEKYQTRCQ